MEGTFECIVKIYPSMNSTQILMYVYVYFDGNMLNSANLSSKLFSNAKNVFLAFDHLTYTLNNHKH